jgi:hypothetical protein
LVSFDIIDIRIQLTHFPKWRKPEQWRRRQEYDRYGLNQRNCSALALFRHCSTVNFSFHNTCTDLGYRLLLLTNIYLPCLESPQRSVGLQSVRLGRVVQGPKNFWRITFYVEALKYVSCIELQDTSHNS